MVALVADRVPARGGLPAGGGRRAGARPGPRRPGRRGQGRPRQRTDDLQTRSDTLRARGRPRSSGAALGGATERTAALRAARRPATGLAAVTGHGAVVRLADAPPLDRPDHRQGRGRRRQPGARPRPAGRRQRAVGRPAPRPSRSTASGSPPRPPSAPPVTPILVDFRPVTSPYEVSAIGPDDLADRFNRPPRPPPACARLADQYGLRLLGADGGPSLTLPAAPEPVPALRPPASRRDLTLGRWQ